MFKIILQLAQFQVHAYIVMLPLQQYYLLKHACLSVLLCAFELTIIVCYNQLVGILQPFYFDASRFL